MARHSVSAESVFSCLITYCLPYAQESKEGNPVLRVPLATFTRFWSPHFVLLMNSDQELHGNRWLS